MRPPPAIAVVLLAAACSSPPPAAAVAAGTFPASWFGVWRGDLETCRDGRCQRLTAMELRIGPEVAPGRTRFQLAYGDGADAPVRDYVLVAVDAALGRWTIDEGQGIELAARLCQDELCSVFAVEGQILVTRYRRVGDTLTFALESFGRDAAIATGGGVSTWREFALQRAVLRRR